MSKTSLLTSLGLLLLCVNAYAQQDVFLQLDPVCMDRFEYHINGAENKGVEYITYRYKVNAEKTYFFEIGSESTNRSLSLPQGLKNCKNLAIDDVLVEKIRSGKTRLSIVRKDEIGYNVSPVHLVSQIKNDGDNVSINSFDFQAALNLKEDNFRKNIAPAENPYEVYYAGYDVVNGLSQHYFHRTSKEVCQPNVDFTYIPELGIVNEYTKVSSLNPNESQLNLVRVNEVSFDSYAQSLSEKTAPVALSEAFAIPASEITVESIAEPVATEAVVVNEMPIPVAYEAPIAPKKVKKQAVKVEAVEPVVISAAIANVPAKCAEVAKANETIVQAGETLYGIARKNGVTVDQLRAWNNLSADQNVGICQHLITKSVAPKPVEKISTEEFVSKGEAVAAEAHAWKDNHSGHHIVQKGETVLGLSRKYGFSEDRFRLMNDLKANEGIKIGQELKMSDCVCDVSKSKNPNEKKFATSSVIGMTDAPKEYSLSSKVSNTDTFIEKGIPAPAKSKAEKKIIPAVVAASTTIATYLRKTVHVVQNDETMLTIAKKYNLPLAKLREINGLDKNEVLIPTQVIYVD